MKKTAYHQLSWVKIKHWDDFEAVPTFGCVYLPIFFHTETELSCITFLRNNEGALFLYYRKAVWKE